MRPIAAALVGWLAGLWELDRRDVADACLIDDETDLVEDLLSDPHADRPAVVTLIRGMYGRLQAYRAIRGKVRSDEVLDDWIAGAWTLVRRLVAARVLGRAP